MALLTRVLLHCNYASCLKEEEGEVSCFLLYKVLISRTVKSFNIQIWFMCFCMNRKDYKEGEENLSLLLVIYNIKNNLINRFISLAAASPDIR